MVKWCFEEDLVMKREGERESKVRIERLPVNLFSDCIEVTARMREERRGAKKRQKARTATGYGGKSMGVSARQLL